VALILLVLLCWTRPEPTVTTVTQVRKEHRHEVSSGQAKATITGGTTTIEQTPVGPKITNEGGAVDFAGSWSNSVTGTVDQETTLFHAEAPCERDKWQADLGAGYNRGGIVYAAGVGVRIIGPCWVRVMGHTNPYTGLVTIGLSGR
jgi:hypothetical protein